MGVLIEGSSSQNRSPVLILYQRFNHVDVDGAIARRHPIVPPAIEHQPYRV
ncbi:MAG: hypothetical protein AAGM36_15660 [Cyanobacteria bacterium J06597_1]